MKTSYKKLVLVTFGLVTLLACSTKKNTFVSRNFHALVVKYNVLFNGNEALKLGVEELRITYQDNFWNILPLERLDVSDEMMMPGDKKNPNFERAEKKAVKAIQKHSINVGGFEHNYQIDNAYFTLGKARYYDQRFLPALEAFNYVLYKYPNSNIIDEVKIWREKTNMRLGNNSSAIANIKKLIRDESLKQDIAKEAEILLAQTYINTKELDSALKHIKRGIKFTKVNEEKARFRFIKGQLYDALEQKDSVLLAYKSVIGMKRKSPRSYVIHSHTNSLQYFDYENGDKLAEEEKFLALADDYENKEFKGLILYHLANFYKKSGDVERSIDYYNLSLNEPTNDNYLLASNYKNLATINFDAGEYVVSGKYYDSTITNLEQKTREFRVVTKKRNNLDDVIKYEQLATEKDSVLHIVAMDSLEQTIYFKGYIRKLQKEEADKKEAEEAKKLASEQKTQSSTPLSGQAKGVQSFYFYNPRLLQLGKVSFKKKWGSRELKDNWRYSKVQNNLLTNEEEETIVDTVKVVTISNPKYDIGTYLKSVPKDSIVVDSVIKDRNFAYYQLGLIYKEKYKRYDLAEEKFNQLLSFEPEQKFVLPVLYNLYKMHLFQKEEEKSTAIKNKIIAEYPDSRHAKLLRNESLAGIIDAPDQAYKKLKDLYDTSQFVEVLDQSEEMLIQYQGEPIVPKLELLRAYTIGKVEGVEAYGKALNFVALNYPNVEEGKKADKLLRASVLKLNRLEFKKSDGGYWKVVFEYERKDSVRVKKDVKKLNDYLEKLEMNTILQTTDFYNRTSDLVVLHRFISEGEAERFLETLTKDKKVKFKKKGVVLSNHNYKVIQVKKNKAAYIEQQKKTS